MWNVARRPGKTSPTSCGRSAASLPAAAYADLRRVFPKLLILVYSMHDTPLFVESAFRAGANGSVTKADPVETLSVAIAAVKSARRHLGPPLTKALEKGGGDSGGTRVVPDELSMRELDVVTLLGQGYGISEIAGRLKISGRTIETHLVRLRAKLGGKSNRELTRAAIQFLHPV